VAGPDLPVPLHLSWPSPFILLVVLVAGPSCVSSPPPADHRQCGTRPRPRRRPSRERPDGFRRSACRRREREVVAEALARIGPTATGHAIRGLPNRKPWLRVGCVLVLGRMINVSTDQPALEILPGSRMRRPGAGQALVRVLYPAPIPAPRTRPRNRLLLWRRISDVSADLPAPDQNGPDREERGARIPTGSLRGDQHWTDRPDADHRV
jgi:hypothetical protein